MKKTIKIILAVVVVGGLVFFLWKSYGGTIKDPGGVRPPTNQFTERIEKEIDSMRRVRADVFCKQYYDAILYHITDYHRQGFLGKDGNLNNKWRDILSKELYSGYAPRFAAQALYVFSGSEWPLTDLVFIRKELALLQSSEHLDPGTAVDDSLSEVKTILSKYDEITGFISSCRNFSFGDYSIDSNFPMDEANNKIQKSTTYISHRLDNSYVNNCTRLRDGLLQVPEILFNKHTGYLREKIRQLSDKYGQYNYQIDYSRGTYDPLKAQIEGVDNNIYGVDDDTYQSRKEGLTTMLDADNDRANEYFRSRIK